jgi:hypothetical protein
VIHAAACGTTTTCAWRTPIRSSWPPPTPAAPRGPGPAARRSNATSSGWRNWNAIAGEFSGVEQAYAIQAGRELRVIVSSKEPPTSRPPKSATTSSTAFEQQFTYPGEIKVTVREIGT